MEVVQATIGASFTLWLLGMLPPIGLLSLEGWWLSAVLISGLLQVLGRWGTTPWKVPLVASSKNCLFERRLQQPKAPERNRFTLLSFHALISSASHGLNPARNPGSSAWEMLLFYPTQRGVGRGRKDRRTRSKINAHGHQNSPYMTGLFMREIKQSKWCEAFMWHLHAPHTWYMFNWCLLLLLLL